MPSCSAARLDRSPLGKAAPPRSFGPRARPYSKQGPPPQPTGLVHLLLAEVALAEVDLGSARQALEAAQKLGGNPLLARVIEARIARQRGNDAEARTLLKSVVTATPGYRPATQLLIELQR